MFKTEEQRKLFQEKLVLARSKRVASANKKIKTKMIKEDMRRHLQSIRRLKVELELFIKLSGETHRRLIKALNHIEKNT